MQKKQDLKVWLHPLTTKIMARALKIDHTETLQHSGLHPYPFPTMSEQGTR